MNEFNLKNFSQWSRMGPRAMFGQFMIDIAKKNKKLIVLSADLGRSSGLDRFKSEFPEKYLSVGISEQNLIGVASGLAKEGFKVFVTSFAPFLSMRASEQIRMNLGYMKLPVNIVALGSGISMGYLGNSHFGLEDIAVMRTIPGIKIFSPADCAEMGKMLHKISDKNLGPSYIRLTGIPGSPIVYNQKFNFSPGEPNVLKKGKDILIIGTGSVLSQCIIASKELEKFKLKCEVINLHTLKPTNHKLLNTIKKFKTVITVEEHSLIGGLYSIISELCSKHKLIKNLIPISLPDKFGPTGTYNYLLNFHGLTAKKIVKKIKNELSLRR